MTWTRSFLVLLSLATANVVLNYKTSKGPNQSTSPSLDTKTNVVMKGQNVSLMCSTQNKSLQIIYSLFRSLNLIGTQKSKGEPVIFNLSISEVHDLGPYKCKAQFSNDSKYSHMFNFTFVDPVTTPVLNITVQTNRYVTLHCISFNGTLPINYTFFKHDIAVSPVIPKYVREPAEFNLTKNNTGEGEEYRCRARNRLPGHEKYSHPVTMPSTGGGSCPFCPQLLLGVSLLVLIVMVLILACWILPKYRARRAMRDKAPRDYGNTPTEVQVYTSIYKNQADEESVPGLEPRQGVSTPQHETEYSEEIHYATPVFQKVTPGGHEARNDDKSGYVYSELTF
ncbi:allergin-1 isoform X1 [Saccopteryx leptura]|uniref:allergin-1 isoform X1 n=1 Tax=Saccopteryx leptura TaxID=249018 RepID=UPI00339CC227